MSISEYFYYCVISYSTKTSNHIVSTFVRIVKISFIWRRGWVSNPRPLAWQASILTIWTTAPYKDRTVKQPISSNRLYTKYFIKIRLKLRIVLCIVPWLLFTELNRLHKISLVLYHILLTQVIWLTSLYEEIIRKLVLQIFLISY